MDIWNSGMVNVWITLHRCLSVTRTTCNNHAKLYSGTCYCETIQLTFYRKLLGIFRIVRIKVGKIIIIWNLIEFSIKFLNVIYSQWKLSNLGDRKDKGRRNIKMGKEKLRNRSRGNTNRGKEEVEDWNYEKRVALMNSLLENILISRVSLSCKFTFTFRYACDY